MEYFQARLFLAYLALTILLETPVLFLTVRRLYALPANAIPARRILLTAFLASFATYPYLWYVVPALIPGRTTALVLGEALVVGLESLVILGILGLSFRRALAASLLCNLTTIVLGTLMNRLIVHYRLFLW